MDWFENDELFFAQLEKGHRYTRYLGERLRAEGFTVDVPEISKRRTVEERHEYLAEIDLRVVLPGGDVPLEVKSRDLRFSGPHDYPYRTAFVDTVSGWRAKPVKPPFVVLVSQRTAGGVAVIPTEHWERDWVARTSGDRVRGFADSRYEVDRRLLLPWAGLVAWLRAREGGASGSGQAAG